MRIVHRMDDPAVNPYQLMISLVVPRPIAWISTVSADGVGNLAPHSFFSVASASPPMLSFTSVEHKDTLANVRATGEFVVNLSTVADLDHVNNSSAAFDRDQDEAAALGIAMEPSVLVAPPRVVSSPASMECRLHSTTELGNSVLVIGEVVAITVKDDVVADGHPQFDLLQPLARLGGTQWGLPGEVLSTPRPSRPDDIS